MLNENQVIEAICKHLKSEGLQIKEQRSTKEQGYDIVAIHPDSGRRLIIEAKGATSACETSARYGKPFDRKQVLSHVARAFYTAAAALQDKDGPADAAVALPDQDPHNEFIKQIRHALATLDITVYRVAADLTVRVDSPENDCLRKA